MLRALLFGIVMTLLPPSAAWAAEADAAPLFPVPGEVNLIALGDHTCRACRLMKPILEELRDKYSGNVAIAFYDLAVHTDLRERFEVKRTPTLLFYDRNGELVDRKAGYMKESVIIKKLSEMGVAPPE